ncbi:MAG TPA: glycosyltransferase [Thermoanaerobaculia bacterium]
MSSPRIRLFLRELLPAPLRESYHRYALRRDFGISARTGKRLPRPIDRTLLRGANVVGYFDSPSGIGQSARGLARAAQAVGIPVARIEASSLEKSPAPAAPYGLNLFHVNADGASSVVEMCGPKVHRGRANVGYWYWETESFPERWRDRFSYFDEIWVASEFCRDSIEKRSPIPVAVVPPPVVIDDRAGPRPSTGFRFLTVADAQSVAERKNPLGAVRAFARAFPRDAGVSLTVKIANPESSPGLVGTLESAAGTTRLDIDTEPATRSDMERLLAGCDAYLSLHRAEGFGLPIAEAMALGKPVVVTDYSGSRDFVDETTGFPVRWRPSTLDRTLGPYEEGTRWAEPDEEHAVEILRAIVEDPAEAARRARAGQRRICERYGLGATGGRLAERLDRLVARLSARP